MSNPADVRTFNFSFPEGVVTMKGLGTKEKELVVSEISYRDKEGEQISESVKRSLAFIRPEAIVNETEIIAAFMEAGVEGSSLTKTAADSSVELAKIEVEEAE